MSLDAEIWSESKIDLKAELPNYENWQMFDGELSYQSEGLQILINQSIEEAPERVLEILPKANYLTAITLEPIGANKCSL